MVQTDDPIRLRVHRAPFLFAPDYLSTADEWQRSFSDLVGRVLASEGVKPGRITSGHFRLTLTFENLDFTIDAHDGVFDLAEQSAFENDDLSDTAWAGVGEAPDDFLSQLTRLRVLEMFRVPVFTLIKPVAAAIWFQMRSRFRRAIAEGFAEIQARPSSPLNDFARIEADAFKYFAIDSGDRPLHATELDEARGPAGTRLFSVCVVPVKRRVAARTKQERLGRKPAYDRAFLARKLDDLMEEHGDFMPGDKAWNAQARLAEKAIDICRSQFGIDLAGSTAKVEAGKVAKRYRAKYSAEN